MLDTAILNNPELALKEEIDFHLIRSGFLSIVRSLRNAFNPEEQY